MSVGQANGLEVEMRGLREYDSFGVRALVATLAITNGSATHIAVVPADIELVDAGGARIGPTSEQPRVGRRGWFYGVPFLAPALIPVNVAVGCARAPHPRDYDRAWQERLTGQLVVEPGQTAVTRVVFAEQVDFGSLSRLRLRGPAGAVEVLLDSRSRSLVPGPGDTLGAE